LANDKLLNFKPPLIVIGGFFIIRIMTPFSTPLSTTFVYFINHLLASEPWARARLQNHAGKIACFDLQAFSLCCKVSADGQLESAPENSADTPVNVTNTPNVTIRLKLSDLPLLAQHREKAFSYVKIEGDADFANTISYLSEHLRWEVAEDLSKVVGDVAAVRMLDTAQAMIASAKKTQQAVHENLAEYFLEENPMLVRPAAVQALGAQVTQLRDDVERFMKRLEKLERTRQ
jgi:ubiquinone biosynthesis protein UbiJ